MATNPTLLTQPIAANGTKNNIPNTTTTPGAMSQDQGFPAETSLPLGAGGVAPTREDFNGAFNLLSGIAFMAQKGWVFLFDENQDYFAGCTVRDPLDSKIYEAINDVSASSTHPSADSVNWKIADLSAYTKTVNSPMFNKRDVITTSGTYTAPVTGWYKITVKGGGGGGGGGHHLGSTYRSGGGGGGEGGTGIAYKHLNAGDALSVVIGAGGANGSGGGGTSVTFGAFSTSATGGTAGDIYRAGGGGDGTVKGAPGTVGFSVPWTLSGAFGGSGGGEGGGIGGTGIGANGLTGGGGGGGGHASGTDYAGGGGGNGYVWFEYFDTTLNP